MLRCWSREQHTNARREFLTDGWVHLTAQAGTRTIYFFLLLSFLVERGHISASSNASKGVIDD
jgi:hypothetical protein